MMDILKREIAPITNEAWAEIEDQAKIILAGNLSGRGLVDFDGPHGWEMASINLGRVKFADTGVIDGVLFGSRKVLPLIEVKVPFSLKMEEMDAISRGLKDADLDPVVAAGQKAAHFEEKALYQGFSKGGIKGIFEASEHKAIPLKKDAKKYQEIVEQGVVAIQEAGIGGPYQLVLGTEPYQLLMQGDERGYPLRKRIEEILGGALSWSPALKGGVILSSRGGDFVLTVGQDFSIGYAGHDASKINLFITESFTFQVLEPKAAVELQPAK